MDIRATKRLQVQVAVGEILRLKLTFVTFSLTTDSAN